MEKCLVLVILLLFEVFLLHKYFLRLNKKEPDNYIALSEIHKSIFKSHFFISYITFRCIPLLLLCYLNEVILNRSDLNELFGNSEWTLYLNLGVTIGHLVSTNALRLIKAMQIFERLLHSIVILLVLSIPFVSKFTYSYIETLMPSTEGIIDNLWSSIITVFIASVFFLNHSEDSQLPKKRVVERIKKYRKVIKRTARKYKADEDLILAIAAFENIQRPSYIRFFERLLCFLFKIEMSQGVMQVKSKTRISDIKSIEIAISKYFRNTKNKKTLLGADFNEEIVGLLKKYNNSDVFVDNVLSLYAYLKHKVVIEE